MDAGGNWLGMMNRVDSRDEEGRVMEQEREVVVLVRPGLRGRNILCPTIFLHATWRWNQRASDLFSNYDDYNVTDTA